MAKPHLTQDYIRGLFDCRPEDGVLIWRKRPAADFISPGAWKAWNTKYCGKIAGYSGFKGYVTVRIDGHNYMAHRLIWAHVHGEIEDGFFVDHADRNPSNNRISNLRLATVSQNCFNTGLSSKNRSGARGVHVTRHGKFFARIIHKGASIYLGTYETLEEASEVYNKEAAKRFGNFFDLSNAAK